MASLGSGVKGTQVQAVFQYDNIVGEFAKLVMESSIIF